MTAARACPLCCGRRHHPVLDVAGVPAVCNALWPDAASARAAPTGDISLVACGCCGLVFNRAFDPAAVPYVPGYENSLHFSPTFQRYADDVASRLVERYDLRGARVLEIGSGSGEFLSRLCERGGNHGLGFDPSHRPGDATPPSERVEVVATRFPGEAVVSADLVVARHVLEHVPDPRGMLRAVRGVLRSSRRGRAPVVYVEVPDAGWMLEQDAVWDVIYEHHTYFTAMTLGRLLRDAGFVVRDSAPAFGGQYRWAEASPADDEHRSSSACPHEPVELLDRAARFGRSYHQAVTSWRETLEDMAADGPVAVWGAGSKGVAFLNAVDPESRVRAVVDVNPRKQGWHTPGTGHRVACPSTLAAEPPAHVLVMNAVYVDEVRASLAALGLESPRVTAVSGGG